MPRLPTDEARRRFAAARVARLATLASDGRPHLVPVVFALAPPRDGDPDRVYLVVDDKPKQPGELQRVRNVAAHPQVAVLADEYDEDWRALWWVRGDGVASVVGEGPERDAAIRLLRRKYPQYRGRQPVFGPAIVVRVTRWTAWAASAA